MKTTGFIKSSTMLIAGLFLLSSATCAQSGSKNYITKEVKVSDFSGIRLQGSPDLEYTQSKNGKTKVEIYGSDNLIDELDVRVENNVLIVKYKEQNRVNFKDKRVLKVIATSPDITSATLEGSGDIYLNSPISTSHMNISLKGSGDIKASHPIRTNNEFTAHLQGSGDIKLNKKITATGKAILKLQGSGDIEAREIAAATGEIILQGSGDIKVNGACNIEKLSVALHGSGDVEVAGINSGETKASLEGSGDVVLKGKSTIARLKLKSSGDLEARDLVANEVEASVEGSGSITCHANNSLKGKVIGSGSIAYKGKPEVKDLSNKKNRIRKI